MQSGAASEIARNGIGAAIGQGILESDNPARAFLQIFASAELPAYEDNTAGRAEEQAKPCRAGLGQLSGNGAERAEVMRRSLP